MAEAYIYDAVRTPRGKGKPDGSLHEITPVQLAAQSLEAIRDRNNLDDTTNVDDVVLGCVSPVGEQGAVIARTAVLQAGFDQTTSGVQVNRFCASALEATNIAAAKVMSGEADMAIGGGVESMSRVPMGSDGGALMVDPAVAIKNYVVPQGISADLIATKYGITRDDADAYAMESQKRSAKSWEEGRFKNSVVPVKDVMGEVVLDHDEFIRPDTDMQALGALNPSFVGMGAMPGFDTIAIQKYPEVEKVEHIHTPGNSSGIVDGAAAILIGNKEIGDKLGLKPRAKFRAMASVGSEPTIMLTGPEFVTQKLLKRAGMSKSDIDLWELNEAFASVVLRYMQAMDLDHSEINVCGGAIAMGHPLGATGAMILGTVLDEMERTNKETALATLCIGGGMGTATVIERV
jgi:acetyl-CoA C-acetyltransferase